MNKIAPLLLLFFCMNSFADKHYPTLWESADPQLQQQLEIIIEEQKLASQVRAGKFALAIADISDPENPRVANLNGDRMFYAASLPKIAILLGAFVQIERGELAADERLMQDMNRMIRQSDNAAATRVLHQVGRDKLLEILQSREFRLYDKQHSGGLWVGKDYGRASAYKRDPLSNHSHGATVMQAVRFYYLLETNRLVNPELSQQMKDILSNPAINHKFVKGLNTVKGARLYRKSGTWKQYHADSAMVEFGEHKYIIVGLATNKRGGQWLTNLAKPLHDLVVNQ